MYIYISMSSLDVSDVHKHGANVGTHTFTLTTIVLYPTDEGFLMLKYFLIIKNITMSKLVRL